MSKEFIIREIDEDKDLDYYSRQGWSVKQVITHEVVHNEVRGLKWDRYHIIFERDNEDEDTKKLKALEIIKRLVKDLKATADVICVYDPVNPYILVAGEDCEHTLKCKTKDELDLLKEVLE